MFWIKHPQPVRPRKAVAEQMVAFSAATPINTQLIVVDQSAQQIADLRSRLGIHDQAAMLRLKSAEKSDAIEG